MNFLVLQHLQIEPAATIGAVIEAAGHTVQVIRLYRDEPVPQSLSGFSGVIVMGGSISANDSHLSFIADEIQLLKQAIKIDLPVLGVCLGAQLLARAAGAQVVVSPVRELGWFPVNKTSCSNEDPLFRNMDGNGLMVFQWHGETFTLPDAATLVATHPDVPHQAFRIGSSQYGLQFHVEADQATIQSWIDAGASEREYLGKSGVATLLVEGRENLASAQKFCTEIVNRWLSITEQYTQE